jgi:hypothetical protein
MKFSAKKISYKWYNEWELDKGPFSEITLPNSKKIALDLVCKIAGATIGYLIHKKAGELFIKDQGLAKKLGKAGAIYGFINSGAKISEENPDKLKITIYIRNKTAEKIINPYFEKRN